MTAYKVVRRHFLYTPIYISPSRRRSEGMVKYRVRKWTKPRFRNGPLSVFPNINDAVNECKHAVQAGSTNCLVFECEYQTSKASAPWYRKWWFGKKIAGPDQGGCGDAVVLAKKVRLRHIVTVCHWEFYQGPKRRQ